LSDVSEYLASGVFYGKVIETAGEAPNRYRNCFTSASPEIPAYFQALRQYGAVENTNHTNDTNRQRSSFFL